jgi:hypothetical protein
MRFAILVAHIRGIRNTYNNHFEKPEGNVSDPGVDGTGQPETGREGPKKSGVIALLFL